MSQSFLSRITGTTPFLFLGFFLLLHTFLPSPTTASTGDNSPAFPVPEVRGATTLWPPSGFRPGNPGARLPINRDSTDYLSTSIPGEVSGHELFQSVDVVDDHLYVAYNAGLIIWNIAGGNAESPSKSHQRDGWIGDFISFPSPGEASNFVDDIAAREGSGGDVLIALSGRDQVGTSLWRHTAAGGLSQVTQHTDRVSHQVRMGKIGSTVYAFGAGPDGVVVFNASTGADFGSLANNLSDRRYLDTLERDGKIYVVASNGTSVRASIWEVPNPASPASAIQRYNGESLGSGVKGVALIEVGANVFLAVVQSHTLSIYNVNTCLDSNGCTSLGTALWQLSLPGPTPSFEFLTHSTGQGNTPYLYYGFETTNISGTKKEGLFDLSNLGTTNVVTEITAGGGVYTDGCGNQVDYWGDYYDSNENGYRNFHPRVGVWNDNVFYRATNATLDVHVLGAAPELDPVMTTQVTSSAPHWMSTPSFQNPISLSATALNCDGSSSWTWQEDDALSTVSGSTSTATLTADVCGSSDCPNRTLQAWGVKNICAGDTGLTINSAALTVQDPRAQIRSVETSPTGNPPGEYPVCTVLDLSADLDGRSPFTYAWTVTRDDTGAIAASGSGSTLEWDTTGESIDPPLFADGFESGDVSLWSTSVPLAGLHDGGTGLGSPEGGSAAYTVDLVVTNLSASHQTSTQIPITLVSLGVLSFDLPEITATDQGSGQFLLQANTNNATEWRWEIENDNGTVDIFDWGTEDDTLVYQWSLEEVRTVTVLARNCEAAAISAAIEVEIIDPTPLIMTEFEIDSAGSPNCFFQALNQQWECQSNQLVRFLVTASGSPASFEFDWDNNGTVDQTINASGPFTHTYTAVGPVTSQVRAKKGVDVSGWLSLSLQIF